MEFGKLPNVDHVDWSLPQDKPLSLNFIQNQPGASATEYLLGTPAWGSKEWVGLTYPPKTKPSDFLYHYARSYQTIELNTTHYRIPSNEQTLKWMEQVTPNFIFCPKIHKDISHRNGGLMDRSLIGEWFKFLENLAEHRGPSFLQLPPHFDYSYKTQLFQFLKNWPDEFQLALEFRHPSWFQDRQILPALTEYLQSRKIGLVITDVAGRRDVLHTSISSTFTMIRFIGNDLHPSDHTRMHDWALRLKKWSDLGLKKVFFFVHEPDDIQAPQMTQIAIRHLVETCRADLRPLVFYTLDTSLNSGY